MQQLGLGYGMASDSANRKMRRIGGWGGELKSWLNQVKDMVETLLALVKNEVDESDRVRSAVCYTLDLKESRREANSLHPFETQKYS